MKKDLIVRKPIVTHSSKYYVAPILHIEGVFGVQHVSVSDTYWCRVGHKHVCYIQ